MRFAHALACITALTSSLVAAAPQTGGSALRPDSSASLACGTVEKPDAAVEKVVADRVARLNARVAEARPSRTDISPVAAVAGVKNVQVYFHVIAKDTTVAGGYVTDTHIANQIAALNRDLAYAGFSFTLVGIDRTINQQWFDFAGPDTTYQTAMKRALRKGTAATLNFYSVGYTSISVQGLLGYATFPQSYRSNPLDDGVSFLFRTIPGLPTGVTIGSNYNQGKTASHEAGHWIGLYHTFQGGCSGSGDYVSDTPAVANPNGGCPAQGSVDSCSGGGADLLLNMMDYTTDPCKTGQVFTAGQSARAFALCEQYRML